MIYVQAKRPEMIGTSILDQNVLKFKLMSKVVAILVPKK